MFVRVSLLDKTGEVHSAHGLNWGAREGRDLNEVNIPVPVAQLQDFESVFSKVYRGAKYPVITHDGKAMELNFTGSGTKLEDGATSGKQLTSAGDNSLLGEWIRGLLGVQPNARISKADLLRYGRTHIDFCKVGSDDNPQVLMDFSVPPRAI